MEDNGNIESMEKKPFWQSKTVWFNVLGCALATVMEHDNPDTIAALLVAGNLFLRFLTKQPLGL